ISAAICRSHTAKNPRHPANRMAGIYDAERTLGTRSRRLRRVSWSSFGNAQSRQFFGELCSANLSWSGDDRAWGANPLNKRNQRKEGTKTMANPRHESQSTSQIGQETRRMADESARAGRKTAETGERIARVT